MTFAAEDVLLHDRATGAWAMHFDGSDVGLAARNLDVLELQADGSLLLSTEVGVTLPGLGAVDDSDIVRFIPTTTGTNTSGSYQWYFDGSDVGLTDNGEDVDALALLTDGRLLVSTSGGATVTGATAGGEDLLAFTPSQLGATTAGTWAVYFDGSDVGLTNNNENLNAVWQDAATGKLYLSTVGAFSVPGLSGDSADVFVCTPSSLGTTTTCTFALFWDGSSNGFAGESVDGLEIVR